MGLDNIPRVYPCVAQKTAKYDEDKIDCKETQNHGGCPWKNEFDLIKLANPKMRPTYGMLGTDCWYRGKWGNRLITTMETKDLDAWEGTSGFSFYGDNGDDGITVEYAKSLALYMRDNRENFKEIIPMFLKVNKETESEYDNYLGDWDYATWWLDFVAEFSDGSSIWY
jgi:hypothetical protein